MINFIQLKRKTDTCSLVYTKVVEKFINPILPYLDNYTISHTTKEDAVNVIFFVEEHVFKDIEAERGKGINVFMCHGIADKKYRDFSRIKKFDYVFVNGDAWVDKLVKQGMSRDRILVNGYTRIEDTYNLKDTYVKKYNDKKTILFAPTHTGCVTTYGKLDSVIEKLEPKYNVLVSSHPNNKQTREPSTNQYLEADVVVGDFGSSMYEAWSLGKPCVFADWVAGKPKVFGDRSIVDIATKSFTGSFEDYIYRNQIGRHANNEDEFIKMIDIACEEGITNEEVSFIDGIFKKELRGNSGKVTASLLKELDNKLKKVR
jgi:CDP-glycerol glycerophosphotransferase (TagB/SpsB family)